MKDVACVLADSSAAEMTSPEKSRTKANRAVAENAGEISACETEFELAERAQQAREELSGLLRNCNKKW